MLNLTNRDGETERLMCEEVGTDETLGVIYLSPLLTEKGRRDYANLLKEAVLHGRDEGWLASQLLREGRTVAVEHRRQDGVRAEILDLAEAVLALAKMELNRYYARAVCRRAVRSRPGVVELYQAEETHGAYPD